MLKTSYISHAAWDSEFFNIPIAKTLSRHLKPRDLDFAVQQCEESKVKCLYCELDPDELDAIVHAQRLGFQFVEFRLVLEHDLRTLPAEYPMAEGLVISEPELPEDGAALAAIADSIAPMSRFTADRRFGPDASRRMYARWLRDHLDDANCRVLVARRNHIPVGLVTLKPHGEAMQLTLLGTAPAQRGQGIGKHLVRAAVHAAATAGAAKLRLVTQGRNVRAVRTYQRAGFLLADATCYFHKWWE